MSTLLSMSLPASLRAGVDRRSSLRLTLLALAAPAALGDPFSPESGGSPNADSIDTLYKLILALATVVLRIDRCQKKRSPAKASPASTVVWLAA